MSEEMTDKQIIIDDYFNIMRDDYGRIYCIQDIGDSKKLIKAIREQNEYIKDKEQECEKAKQNAQDTYDLWQALIESFNILQGEKIKLEQECEELKEQLEIAKQNCSLEYEFKMIYKQTLTEIKEICNKTVCDYLQCSLNYNHSKDFECEKTSCNRAKRRKFILKILQKINECEVGNAR